MAHLMKQTEQTIFLIENTICHEIVAETILIFWNKQNIYLRLFNVIMKKTLFDFVPHFIRRSGRFQAIAGTHYTHDSNYGIYTFLVSEVDNNAPCVI